jgi:MFS family permease
VAVFMALLDVTIVNIAVPDIRTSFPQDSLGDLSWILNGYNIVFAAALVPAGRLADRVGRKRRFIGGVLVFLAASLL